MENRGAHTDIADRLRGGIWGLLVGDALGDRAPPPGRGAGSDGAMNVEWTDAGSRPGGRLGNLSLAHG
jgi:hypothetical protein